MNLRASIAFLNKALAALDGEPEVLIVEDNLDDELTLCRSLRNFLCRVTTCRTGRQAVELIKGKHFDFIFLDLSLPDTDGVTVLQQTEHCRRSTVVVILSGSKPLSEESLEKLLVSRAP